MKVLKKQTKKSKKKKCSSKIPTSERKYKPSKKTRIDRTKIASYGFQIVGVKNNVDRKGRVTCKWCKSCTRTYDLNRKYFDYSEIREHSELYHQGELNRMEKVLKQHMNTSKGDDYTHLHYFAAATKAGNNSFLYSLDTEESDVFNTHEVPREILRLLKLLDFLVLTAQGNQ